MTINLCGLHHTCFDSTPQLNVHWFIKPSQPTVSAELNEANVNILSNVTVKWIFYIKMFISDYHSFEVNYYVADYRLRLFLVHASLETAVMHLFCRSHEKTVLLILRLIAHGYKQPQLCILLPKCLNANFIHIAIFLKKSL